MNLNELKNEKVKITIAGDEVEVKSDDPVKDTLTRILQEKGDVQAVMDGAIDEFIKSYLLEYSSK